MAKAPKSKLSAPQSWTGGDLRMHLACAEAEKHIRAFKIDANPQHIVDAFRVFRRLKLPVPPNVIKNLDRVLDDLKEKPTGNAAKHTVRDLRILERVLTKDDKIAKRTDSKLLALIATQHSMTVPAVKQVIHRFRRIERDREYNLPRAFRKPKA